ncbi:MAG: alpha-ketoglutarate-dependent dioxygenase AlkB [Sphingomonas sp.]
MSPLARDLFDEPAVRGLRHAENIVTAAEEQALIDRIDACELEPFKFQQWLGRRLTASFGSRYDFERGQMAPAPPIPDWLLPVRARVAAFAELDPALLVQALVIRYDPGAGIGWHRDRPVYGQVTGLSLGEPAVLRLRRRRAAGFERASVALAPRAAYLLSGSVRHDWEHSIVPLERTRWSITFRTLADRNLDRA